MLRRQKSSDTLAEWLRRRPAKPVGSARVGSNPTGVVLAVRAGKLQVNENYFSDGRKHNRKTMGPVRIELTTLGL